LVIFLDLAPKEEKADAEVAKRARAAAIFMVRVVMLWLVQVAVELANYESTENLRLRISRGTLADGHVIVHMNHSLAPRHRLTVVRTALPYSPEINTPRLGFSALILLKSKLTFSKF
jgi:uncharacterized membrane protein